MAKLSFGVGIDWFQATFDGARDPYALRQWARDIAPKQRWTAAKPSNGYLWACRGDSGMLAQSGERDDMGSHLTIPGSAMEESLDDYQKFIALTIAARRCSRLDLNLDCTGAVGLTAQLAASVINRTCITRAKKWSVVYSNDGGITAYIGARGSDRMLRLYDKGAEQGYPELNWHRAELELRNDAATRAMKLFRQVSLRDITVPWIDAFVKFDNPVWARMIAGAQGDYVRSTRKLTDGRRWIVQDVSRMVAKRVNLGDDELLADFGERISANIT